MKPMPHLGAKDLPKLDFLTSRYMDWMLRELLEHGILETNESAKRMRPGTRRKRELFLIEHGMVTVTEYKDEKNRNRKRLVLTKKGKDIITRVFELETLI